MGCGKKVRERRDDKDEGQKMNVIIIANPKSGKGAAGRRMPKVKEFLEKNNVRTEVYITKGPGDATRAAKKAAMSGRHRIIAASGGDGTVNEVVNGIMLSGRGKKQDFAILPLGTENVLAQETGIPLKTMNAAKLILSRKPRLIDVGRAGKRYFVLMAGIGFDAHVATKVRPVIKRMLGSAAYPIAAWNEIFRYKHANITTRIDNKTTVRGSFVVVGNTRLYGGMLKITSEARIDDGLLDICVFKGNDLLSFIRYAIGSITRRHIKFSDIEYHQAKEIFIDSRPKVLCHVDCEVIGKTPVKIKVFPKALRLIVP